ncbi:MAG: ATP synthase subunit C [Candidatus Caldarchaeum sp.]|nr:ATP synthase subunit C [Candidatus Caldarchaeum sp.]
MDATRQNEETMNKQFLPLASLVFLGFLLSFSPAQAVDGDSIFGELGAKTFSAAIAFSAAVASSAWGLSRAGSAGLAATAERPEVRTTAIIISAFAEALGIYGIVVAFFILGAG